MKRALAALGVAATLTAVVVACSNDQYSQCGDGHTVCDQNGNPLLYAPYIMPAYGIYGQPGYHPAITIQPGAPNYHVTYINHPPNYTPPVAPAPPPSNPKNTVPKAPVSAPAPPGYKAPTVKVSAPSVKVNAPSVGIKPAAPAPKPYSPPPARSGK